MDALHRQVLPFLLRRMKEDVLQDLPPKIIQDYYCTLSPLQVRNLVIMVGGWYDMLLAVSYKLQKY
jgi:SNF2 family DNA or RNA helicase